MRLTLLSHFIGRGGSTGFFIQLRDFFQSCGHEVSLVVGHDAPDPMAKEYRVAPSVPGQNWRQRMLAYVRTIEQGLERPLPTGYRSELSLALPAWLRAIGASIERGSSEARWPLCGRYG